MITRTFFSAPPKFGAASPKSSSAPPKFSATSPQFGATAYSDILRDFAFYLGKSPTPEKYIYVVVQTLRVEHQKGRTQVDTVVDVFTRDREGNGTTYKKTGRERKEFFFQRRGSNFIMQPVECNVKGNTLTLK